MIKAVSGICSSALGALTYILFEVYASSVQQWLHEEPPEKVQTVGEVVILCYLAYAVVVALPCFFLPGWLTRKPSPSSEGKPKNGLLH